MMLYQQLQRALQLTDISIWLGNRDCR